MTTLLLGGYVFTTVLFAAAAYMAYLFYQEFSTAEGTPLEGKCIYAGIASLSAATLFYGVFDFTGADIYMKISVLTSFLAAVLLFDAGYILRDKYIRKNQPHSGGSVVGSGKGVGREEEKAEAEEEGEEYGKYGGNAGDGDKRYGNDVGKRYEKDPKGMDGGKEARYEKELGEESEGYGGETTGFPGSGSAESSFGDSVEVLDSGGGVKPDFLVEEGSFDIDVPDAPEVKEIETPEIEKGPLFIRVEKFRNAEETLADMRKVVDEIESDVGSLENGLDEDTRMRKELEAIINKLEASLGSAKDIVSP